MYKVLFIILFAGAIWLGLSKIKSIVAETAKAHVVEAAPIIGLGPFLQLVHAGNIAIVDMRSAQDYDYSHIKDALSVQQLDSANTDDRLKKARNIILYSSGGVTDEMRQYAQTLSKQGIQGTAFYSGGFREWLGAGLPVEKNN